MERLRKIFVILFVAVVAFAGLYGCGDPYKNMALTIDDGSAGALDRTIEYDGENDTFSVTAIVSGVGKGVNTSVVFTSQDTNVVVLDGNPTVDGGTTTQGFKIKTTGKTYITVTTMEGTLSKNISINIIAYAESISLIHQNNFEKTLPIIKTEKTDLTKIVTNLGSAFIEFTPSYTTERSVEYQIYTDTGARHELDKSKYVVEGNYITFDESLNVENPLYISATCKNKDGQNISTGLTKVTLLEPIKLSDYRLMYSYAKDNDPNGDNVVELIDIDKDVSGEADYHIYLADQYAGDANNDSKNIFLVKNNADGKTPNFANVHSSSDSVSFTKVDKSTDNYVYMYASTIKGKSTLNSSKYTRNTFIICNGSGEGNNDLIYFNINYAGFEEYFDGIEISLKVTIDAFPAGVVIDMDDDVQGNYWYNQEDTIDVYNNYLNQLGTPFYVKVLNNAYDTVTTQYAYVGVMGFWDENDAKYVKLNSITSQISLSEYKPNGAQYIVNEYAEALNNDIKKYAATVDSYYTIYDAKGNIVTPYTKVKSGSLLYIKYNYQGDYESFNNSDFVLYARSILDPAITTFNLSTYDTGAIEDANLRFRNTLHEMLPNYTVNLNNMSFYAGDDTSQNTPQDVKILNSAGVAYGSADRLNIPDNNTGLNYELNGNGLVDWVRTSDPDNPYYYDNDNMCRRLRLLDTTNKNKVGTATLLVSAPNGYYDVIDINVTIDMGNVVTQLMVGNMLLNGEDVQTLQMNVNSVIDVSVVFDNMLYTDSLPYGYKMEHVSTTSKVGFSSNKLTSGSDPTEGYERHTFTITYMPDAAVAPKTFEINIMVVRPVNYITRSNAYVDMFYSDVIKPITAEAYGQTAIDQSYVNKDGNETQYIDVVNKVNSVTKFVVNPINSNIDLSKVKLEIGYNNLWQILPIEPSANKDYYYFRLHFTFDLEEKDKPNQIIIGDSQREKDAQYYAVKLTSETINGENCMLLYINDVSLWVYSNDGGYRQSTQDINFKIRLTYTEEHDLILSRNYYIGCVDGPYRTDTISNEYYLYTDINNPETSKVTYVGGYKFVPSEKENGGSFVNTSTLCFGGISFEITGLGQDANGNDVYGFNYNKYQVELPAVVNYSLKSPAKTSKIEFSGILAESDEYSNWYEKLFNKNQLEDKFKFEFTYSTMPYNVEIEGLLFNYWGNDTNSTQHISQLYYQNLTDGTYTRTPNAEGCKYRVAGAITTSFFTQSKGLLIMVDYFSKKITIVVSDDADLLFNNPTLENYEPSKDSFNGNGETIEGALTKFTKFMETQNNSINLRFISVDTYANASQMYTNLRFNLRTGDVTNPYAISSIEDFDMIRNDLSASYQLVSDLDFKDVYSWIPIGTENTPFEGNLFSGTYNEKSDFLYSIKNFNISMTTEQTFVGLFGYVKNAGFQNINFENFLIDYTFDDASEGNSNAIVCVGFLAGYAFNCNVFNCTFIDNTEVNYDNYNISYVSQLTEGKDKHGVVVNDSSDGTSYYIGGVFGVFSGTISGIEAKIKVFHSLTSTTLTIRLGGIIGANVKLSEDSININMPGSLQNNIFTVVGSASNTNTTSAGGFAGYLTSPDGVLENINITSYVIGLDNVGGIIGATTASDTINNSTWSGYIEGNENIGGLVGKAEADIELNSCKVQFVKHDTDVLKHRSSIVGTNYIGGLVGYAGANFTSNYSSVMSYVDYYTGDTYRVLNESYASKVADGTYSYDDLTQEEILNDYYFGDMVVLLSGSDVNMGGLVSAAQTGVDVNNCYFNAHAVVCGENKATFGGVVGYLGGTGLKITYTAINGDFYHDNDSSKVGGFVGVIPDNVKLHSYTIYDNIDVNQGINPDSLKIQDYNIRQSYTFLKYAKLGENLQYIENFSAVNETFETAACSKELLAINVKYEAGNYNDHKVLSIQYVTPTETRYDTFALDSNNLGNINLSIKFAGLPDGGSYSNLEDKRSGSEPSLNATWNSNVLTIALGVHSVNAYGTVYSYQPKYTQYEVPNVLTLNSFYNNFNSIVRVFKSDNSSVTTKLHVFRVENSKNTEVTLLEEGSNNYKFDYFTQRAVKSGDAVNTYFTTFDNLKQMAFASGSFEISYDSLVNDSKQVYPYNANYSTYFKYKMGAFKSTDDFAIYTTAPTELSKFAYDLSDIKNISTINDKISSLANIYKYVDGDDTKYKVDNHAYVVSEGTALNDDQINLNVYAPSASAIYDSLDKNNTEYFLDCYKWYFNISEQKDQILNGLPVPLQNYKLVDLQSNIPVLIVDVPAREIYGGTKDNYQDVNSGITILTYYGKDANGNSDSRNIKSIDEILNVFTIPQLANESIIYTSSDLSVVKIDRNINLQVIGEGSVTITATSELSGLSVNFDIIVIAYDYHEKEWNISGMNNEIHNDEISIPIDNGEVITIANGYEGIYTFGVRFEFSVSDIEVNEVGKTPEDFLQALNIAGSVALYKQVGNKVIIELDGLTHAVSCNILGSVEIKHTLYFKYQYGGYIYTYDIDSKEIFYSFTEAVYGITGADGFSIYALDSHTFSVVVNCDSESPKLNLYLSLINGDNDKIKTIYDINNYQTFNLSDYDLGYLTLNVQSISFDPINKLKTYTFGIAVDESEQTLIQKEYDYLFRFVVNEAPDIFHEINIRLLPQDVQSVYLNHYTNVFFTANSDVDVNVNPDNYNSYKYPSETIIPGYISLLQVNLYPYFGRFDYITAEVDLAGVAINQVVEVYNSGNDDQYSWYEYYSKGQTIINGINGIVTVAKYSSKDLSLDPSKQLGYNGTLFFALSADTNLSSYQVNVTIKGYINNEDIALFSETATLIVEARPDVIITTNTREVMFGDVVDLEIQTHNVDGDFVASLKVSGVNAEFINVLGSVVNNGNSYSFKFNDSAFTYSSFHAYMYREVVLTLLVSKNINGINVVDSSQVTFLLVPFRVVDIDINIDGLTKSGANVIVDYYQPYDVLITTNAEYSLGYAEWLQKNRSEETIQKQLAKVNLQIRENIANFSIIKQGTSVSRTALLYPGSNTQYLGEIKLEYHTNYDLSIRFISTEFSNFLWADIGIDYTTAGIVVTPHERGMFSFSDYLSVTIYTNSSEDTPEPITTVEDFKSMSKGINYILMKDLYLAMWEPISADFKSLDGNGYVITLVSFADVSSMGLRSGEYGYNVGIFSQISEETTIKNLTVEINPSTMPMDFTQDKAYDDVVNAAIESDYKIPGATVDHSSAYPTTLDVDISSLKTQTNFGVLAGTNLGTITNVSIVNNATSLRKLRNDALDQLETTKTNRLDPEGDNFSKSITKFANVNSTDTIRVSYMFENKDETTSRNNNISLLVGYNNGFITNSNAENVSISGEDYVAGLVARNLGKISSSYFKGGNIIGDSTTKANSGNGGLVAINSGEIYYSYVEGKKFNETSSEIINLGSISFSEGDYRGSGIITNSYAGGFVYLNSGKINNCYAKILVSGIYASGFVYKCESEDASVEYCYSISNVQTNATTNTPFLKSTNVQNKANIIDCYYLYDKSISNLAEDIAESVSKSEFKEYTTFAGYAFNVDYSTNSEILDAVWFIPGGYSPDITSKYFKQSTYLDDSPQLVSANQRTLSIRYMSGAEEGETAYVYGYVDKIYPNGTSKDFVYAYRGSTTNPILINSASGFNLAVIDGDDDVAETRKFRIIKDISFTTDDEVATTYTSVFKGKLDGNGMTIQNLRISADEIEDAEITKLGLFKEIKGSVVRDKDGKVVATEPGQESNYAVVKNLNIEVSQINGMTVNLVGVLAGEITDAKIYNVHVEGENYTVQGLNGVGAIAGRVMGDTDLVNISSNVSVKSNYYFQYNGFSKELANVESIQKFHAYMNYSDSAKDNTNLKYVSYAGGIVGIVDVDAFAEDTQLDQLRQEMYRLRRLSTTGDITIEGEVVGGLFGYLSSTSNVSDCDLVVTNLMALKGSRVVGGFVGHNEGTIKNCTVINYNQEEIDIDIANNTDKYDNATQDYNIGAQNLFQGNAMFIGGIAGINLGGTITKTYNRVNVACENSLYAGGVAGLTIKGVYENIYITGSVYAHLAYGGMFGAVIDTDQTNKVPELTSSDKFGFFMGNEISNISEKEISTTAKITNIVLSNIWKYSHLNTIRSTYSKPNTPAANIGMMAGYVDGTMSLELINSSLGAIVDNVGDRIKSDNIYYKQTYTYRSIKDSTANKIVISEFGNQYNLLINAFGITEDTGEPNTSGYDKVYNGVDTYLLGASSSNYTTFINNDMRFISGKYRFVLNDPYDSSPTEQAYYIFSRMTTCGSLRSLNEIYQRKYDYTKANEFYADLGTLYSSKYSENVDSVSGVSYVDADGNTKTDGDGTARYKAVSMYSQWDSKDWYGVGLTAEGNRADDEYLYPQHKNSTIEVDKYYIYNYDDLKILMSENANLSAEYILMNDIYWEATSYDTWTPIGTEEKPFTGTLRSAHVGDLDGINSVKENRTYTIFNVNLNTTDVNRTISVGYTGGAKDSSANSGAIGIFAYSSGAKFANFNIHIVDIDTSNKEYEYIGALVGCANNSCEFSNISLLGSSSKFTVKTGSSGTWRDNLKEYKDSNNQTIEVGGLDYYIPYADILTTISTKSSASIKTGSSAYVGGLVGFADYITLNSQNAVPEECYVDVDGNGVYTLTKLRSSSLQVNNIKLEVKGNGDSTSYRHYIGGVFGYVKFSKSENEIKSIDGAEDNIKYYTAGVTALDITATLNSSAKSKALNSNKTALGVYVGGFAGYMVGSSGKITINGVLINNTTITSIINADKITNESLVAVGGAFGYMSDVSINQMMVKGTNTITTTNDKNSQIGGLFGHAEFVGNLSNVVVEGSITLNITNSDTAVNKYYGGIFGNLLSSTTISNIVAKGNITLSPSTGNSNFYSGGFAGRLGGGTFENIILNNVIATTGNPLAVGGFAGITENGMSINKSYVGGTIETTSTEFVGGFIGKAFTTIEDNAIAELKECVSNVNIEANAISGKQLCVGGLVGASGYVNASGAIDFTDEKKLPLNISDGYNSGNLNIKVAIGSPSLAVGGILGAGTLVVGGNLINIGNLKVEDTNGNLKDLINNSYSTDYAKSTIGGIIGYYVSDSNSSALKNAYYNKDMLEITNNYGTGLTTEEMLYESIVVNENWTHDVAENNYYYPVLNWINNYPITDAGTDPNSWFDVVDFVVGLQGEGTKINPQECDDIATANGLIQSKNKAVIISCANTGMTDNISLYNTTLYFKNGTQGHDPAFGYVDNESVIHGLQLLSSTTDYIVENNDGYLVGWTVLANNNIIGTNTGVVIGSYFTLSVSDLTSTYIIGNNSNNANVSGSHFGVILYSKFTVNFESTTTLSGGSNQGLFTTTNAGYAKNLGMYLNNSVIQSQITYNNVNASSALSTHMSQKHSYEPYNNCMFKFSELGYYYRSTGAPTTISTYSPYDGAVEYNISNVANSTSYDFKNIWTWLDSTSPVTLMSLEKDHFNDKELRSKSWEWIGTHYDNYAEEYGRPIARNSAIEVYNEYQLAYELYNIKTETTVKYLGDVSLDLVGKVWTPVGNVGNPFNSILDFGGRVINNVMIISDKQYLGFIGVLGGNGSIKNITFRNINLINSGSSTSNCYIGSVVGALMGQATLSRVGVEGFTPYNHTTYTGALFGKISSSEINQIVDAYVAVEFMSGNLVNPICVSNEANINVHNYYVYGYNSARQIVTSMLKSVTYNNIIKSGDYVVISTVTINVYSGRNAETNLPYFDFINDWSSTEDSDGTIATNFGLPRFNTKNLQNWADVVETPNELNSTEISTASELAQFANYINSGKIFTGTVTLTSDIDLSTAPEVVRSVVEATDSRGMLWTPIGTEDAPFKGTFDGQNHTIYGLACAGTNYAGLFGYTSGATIKNINFLGKNNDSNASLNARVGTRISIEPESGKIGYAGIVVAHATNSTIQDITIKTESDGKQYRSYVKLNNTEKAYIGGVVGYSLGSTLFNNLVQGCLFDGDVTTSDDKQMFTISTKITNGLPVAMGGIVGAMEEYNSKPSYAMSNVVKDVNIKNTSGNTFDYNGDGTSTELKYFNQKDTETNNASAIYFGTGGIVGMSKNSRIVSNEVQTYFSTASNNKALGGIVGQLYGGTVQECVALFPGATYTLGSGGTRGLIVGYGAKAQALNLFAISPYSLNMFGGSYIPQISDYNLSQDEINQEKYKGNWDNSLNVKNSDKFRMSGYINYKVTFSGTVSSDSISGYDITTGRLISESNYVKVTSSNTENNINTSAWHPSTNRNIFITVQTGESTTTTYWLEDEEMYTINTAQTNYFAVNSDYYTLAESKETSTYSFGGKQLQKSLLFNWSSSGDVLLGDKYYDATSHTSSLTHSDQFDEWLYSLLRFRNDGKEIAFNMELTFRDTTGSISNLVSTKEYPFGSRTRLTTITGGVNPVKLNINGEITDNVGLFGYGINLSFKDISLTGNVTGRYRVGALVGYADNMLLDSNGKPQMINYINIDSTANVTGSAVVGGVIGEGYFININTLKTGDTNALSGRVKATSMVDSNTYYSSNTYGLGSSYDINSSSRRKRNIAYMKNATTRGMLEFTERYDIQSPYSNSDDRIMWATMVGSAIGLAQYNVNVSNISSTATVQANSNAKQGSVGGIVGQHENVFISAVDERGITHEGSEGYFLANNTTYTGYIQVATESSVLVGNRGGLVGKTSSDVNGYTKDSGRIYSKISNCTVGYNGITYTIKGSGYVAGITPMFTGVIENTINYYNVDSVGSTGDSDYTGGLVGELIGKIIGCNNYGDVTAYSRYTSGLVAYLQGSCMDSANYGTILDKGTSNSFIYIVGGVVGYISSKDCSIGDESITRQIIGCSNEGNITSNYNGEKSTCTYVGGIVGYVSKGAIIGTIVDENKGAGSTNGGNTNKATISAKYNVGGIVGYATNDNAKKLDGNDTNRTDDTMIDNNYVYGTNIQNVSNYAGGIVGRFDGVAGGLGIISNNINNSSIYDNDATFYAGGIVGHAAYATIEGNQNYMDIIGKTWLGGIIGYGQEVVNVINNINYATIGSGIGSHTGGIAGTILGSGEIKDNTNNGRIFGSYSTGGIIGFYNYYNTEATSSIFSNTNTGNVTSDKNSAGGIVGAFRHSPDGTTFNISNNKNQGNITGESEVGGIVGYVSSASYTNSTIIQFNNNSGIILSTSGNDYGQIIGATDNTGSHIVVSDNTPNS